MKLFITILSIYCLVNTTNSFGFAICKGHPAEKPDINHSTNIINVREFVKLSAKEFSLISGKKMNLWNRLSFSLLKIRMKHDLKNNSNLSISDFYSKSSHHMSPWLWVGIGVVLL
jgi:hypothetical protein